MVLVLEPLNHLQSTSINIRNIDRGLNGEDLAVPPREGPALPVHLHPCCHAWPTWETPNQDVTGTLGFSKKMVRIVVSRMVPSSVQPLQPVQPTVERTQMFMSFTVCWIGHREWFTVLQTVDHFLAVSTHRMVDDSFASVMAMIPAYSRL